MRRAAAPAPDAATEPRPAAPGAAAAGPRATARARLPADAPPIATAARRLPTGARAAAAKTARPALTAAALGAAAVALTGVATALARAAAALAAAALVRAVAALTRAASLTRAAVAPTRAAAARAATAKAARPALAAAALGAAALAPAASAEAPPARVVSVNLCTDQLAMMLAAPGQLVSVSDVALDPVASAMAAEAAAYRINHATAEEVLLLAPDLVLASEFSPPATLAMARRLGLRVETFPIETSFDDARANIRRMGALLGREARAEELVRELDAAEAPQPPGPRPRAALVYANAYSSGAGTLADAILAAAGLRNVAAERGMVGMGRLPLEIIALERPDLVVLGQDYGQPALAQQTLRHPILRNLGAVEAAVADNLWVCGSPLLARAVAELRAAAAPLRQQVQP